MDEGYITLSRRFFASEIWRTTRAFNESEAWLDLIQSARFEPSAITSRIGCYEVTWGRGQYPASVKFLAKRWGRSERWVKSFLEKLRRAKMITTDASQGTTVVTLVNFDKYNPLPKLPKEAARPSYPTSSLTQLTELIDSRLREMLANPLTQLPDQPRPTPDSNTKKDNNILEEELDNACVRACEEGYAAEALRSPIWVEDMLRCYKLTPDGLHSLFDEFVLDCRCYGHTHTDPGDFKRHFNNWLRDKRDREQKKQKDAENTKGHEDRRRGHEVAASGEKDYNSTF